MIDIRLICVYIREKKKILTYNIQSLQTCFIIFDMEAFWIGYLIRYDRIWYLTNLSWGMYPTVVDEIRITSWWFIPKDFWGFNQETQPSAAVRAAESCTARPYLQPRPQRLEADFTTYWLIIVNSIRNY